MMPSRLYDALKFLAQIALPAVGTLYFSLSQTWGLANGEQVVGTIVAVDAFLGVLLGLSSRVYNESDKRFAGQIDVEEIDGKKVFSLNLNMDPDLLEDKSEVTFKVDSPDPV